MTASRAMGRSSYGSGVVVLLLGAAGLAAAGEGVRPASWPEVEVRQELQPLTFTGDPSVSDAVSAYWRYYGLDLPGAEHRLGTRRSGTVELAVQVFVTPTSRGTVLLVHGYYDHVGIWRRVIPPLLEAGFAVAAYDQPGHGLSTGPRSSVGDFEEYVTALDDMLALCQGHLPAPVHLVAHSMGAGITMDRLTRTPAVAVARIVLLAPLIRSAHWGASRLGDRLTPGFVDSVPRVYRANSTDRAFLEFVRDDPLQYDRVPMAWVKAHRAWAARMENAPVTDQAVVVLQGSDDSTVDADYNLAWIRRTFPKAQATVIPQAGHQLMNEAEPLRAEVLRRIREALGESAGDSRR